MTKMGKVYTKKASKKQSSGQVVKHKITVVKSRKDKRKQNRKQKKLSKLQFYQNKFKTKSREGNDSDNEDKTAEKSNADQKVVGEQKVMEVKIKKDAQAKLKNARRKKELLRDNKVEEKNIKRLEKQLKLNKKKGKDKEVKLPSSFAAEGLDYVLDVCDSSKIDQLALSEEESTEFEDSEEELEGEAYYSEEENKLADSGVDDDVDTSENSDDIDEHEREESSGDFQNEELRNESNPHEDNDPELNTNSEGSDGLWEDIYGRTRDAKGNIVQFKGTDSSNLITSENQDRNTTNKYIPPAMRAKSGADDEKKLKLQRQIKGLLNRLAESNLHLVCRQMEDFYSNNSRNDMNDCLSQLFTSSIITNSGTTTTPGKYVKLNIFRAECFRICYPRIIT